MTFSPRLRPAGSTVRLVRPAAALGFALALATAVVTVGAQSQPRKIYTSLVDKKGAPVTTVTPADLVVREDGVAREILSVTPATDPMRVALLVDNSQAATQSIQFLRDGPDPVRHPTDRRRATRSPWSRSATGRRSRSTRPPSSPG